MRMHALRSCDTCRAALTALRAAGHSPVVVDVRDDAVASQDLQRFLESFGPALVNRRSTTWRSLSEAERSRPAIELLAAHPTLMKRPVIETDDGAMYLGWDKAVQAALLPTR